jgi:hypothetical protein
VKDRGVKRDGILLPCSSLHRHTNISIYPRMDQAHYYDNYAGADPGGGGWGG